MDVELTTAAAADIIDAAVYYELEQPGLGLRFEQQVDATITRIAENPRKYPVVGPDVRRALLRVFPFSVYFAFLDERIRVFAVLHQHRDPTSAWQQPNKAIRERSGSG